MRSASANTSSSASLAPFRVVVPEVNADFGAHERPRITDAIPPRRPLKSRKSPP